MKKEKKIPRGYATIADCFKMTGLSKSQLYRLILSDKVKYKTPKQTDKYCINLQSLQDYIDNSEMLKRGVWGSVDTSNMYYPVVGYDFMYATTPDGRIFNLTSGQELKPSSNGSYYQVCLQKNGKRVFKFISHVILGSQGKGKNAYNKSILHHINRDHADNRLINILPVFPWEHQHLHRLIDTEKMEEYVEMVNKIAAENSEKLYKVPHPDFVSDNKNSYYLMITQRGYDIYVSGGEIPFAEVKMEICEPTSKQGDSSCD